MNYAQSSPLLLFDGVCHLCAGSVQWVLKRDKKGIFRFAPLQSEVGQQALKGLGVSENVDSVVLIIGQRAYVRSDAALEVARRLDFPWSLLAVFRVVPRLVRDAVYDWIARHRYRWFGRSETCWVPKAEWRARFLS
ncbi:MAG: thiol-disulfide oxidoreductase DCC family protein [Saprospiraceae bacterium]|nr:thiol-disulfide oxidoreductase DCC family protein [Saprospiraceae bacterium]MDW8230794.1 thiol-disulfide oxidoreductase DCC family protein [Saprospiraceae bacterium]